MAKEVRLADGARVLQNVANFANYMNPGVTRLIQQSELMSKTEQQNLLEKI